MSDSKESIQEKLDSSFEGYGVAMARSNYSSYENIEPSITVRTSYTDEDYYAFRPEEMPASYSKKQIKQSVRAYEKFGIIKQVIDLMGDFPSQGINLVHKNKREQNFYRKWWKKVHGTERSERFLNTLYKYGNIIVERELAKINTRQKREMSQAKIYKNQIPIKYTFRNPLSVDVKGCELGIIDKVYTIKIPNSIKKAYKDPKQRDLLLSKLPENFKKALSEGKTHAELDPLNTKVYHYKKNDWELWASPLVSSLLDDLSDLAKLKLADRSALDGAISNIRLWTLGSLDPQILPKKEVFDKLRSILDSNVGGGVIDLVWGPELKFTESKSEAWRFLGADKYGPVLNSIYTGLGIPSSLLGGNGSQGFTNNFFSLKVLIDKLEYGRTLLRDFWETEIQLVQKAMGFTTPAKLIFEHMLLSDEQAEKSLIMQMVDRNIISNERARERLKEDNEIETHRLVQENKDQKNGKLPLKSGPYHDPMIESDYIKIAMNKDQLGIEDVSDKVPSRSPEIYLQNQKPKAPETLNGRPRFSKDNGPRKQKVVLPRTKANSFGWATSAYKTISNIVNPLLLESFGRKNLRSASKAEINIIEETKFDILCSVSFGEDITEESIHLCLDKIEKGLINREPKILSKTMQAEFINENGKPPLIEQIRQMNVMAYVLCLE